MGNEDLESQIGRFNNQFETPDEVGEPQRMGVSELRVVVESVWPRVEAILQGFEVYVDEETTGVYCYMGDFGALSMPDVNSPSQCSGVVFGILDNISKLVSFNFGGASSHYECFREDFERANRLLATLLISATWNAQAFEKIWIDQTQEPLKQIMKLGIIPELLLSSFSDAKTDPFLFKNREWKFGAAFEGVIDFAASSKADFLRALSCFFENSDLEMDDFFPILEDLAKDLMAVLASENAIREKSDPLHIKKIFVQIIASYIRRETISGIFNRGYLDIKNSEIPDFVKLPLLILACCFLGYVQMHQMKERPHGFLFPENPVLLKWPNLVMKPFLDWHKLVTE